MPKYTFQTTTPTAWRYSNRLRNRSNAFSDEIHTLNWQTSHLIYFLPTAIVLLILYSLFFAIVLLILLFFRLYFLYFTLLYFTLLAFKNPREYPMKGFLCIFVTGALLLCVASLWAESITFGSVKYNKQTIHYNTTMEIVKMGKKDGRVITTGNMSSRKIKKIKIKVLNRKKGHAHKMRVTYTKAWEFAREDGIDHERTSPTEGKTYIVKHTSVVYQGGGTPSKWEVNYVRKDLAEMEQFRKELMGRTLKVGEQAPLKKALTTILNAKSMESVNMSIILNKVEIRGDRRIAVFDVKAMQKGKIHYHMFMLLTMAGTLEVDVASSQVVQIKLEGPIRISAAKDSAIGDKGKMQILIRTEI